jgi:hypothetical protein
MGCSSPGCWTDILRKDRTTKDPRNLQILPKINGDSRLTKQTSKTKSKLPRPSMRWHRHVTKLTSLLVYFNLPSNHENIANTTLRKSHTNPSTTSPPTQTKPKLTMESDNLRTASLYINNQLLSRGLLRNGQTIEFARPSTGEGGVDGTMGRVMSVINDLILRRDVSFSFPPLLSQIQEP